MNVPQSIHHEFTFAVAADRQIRYAIEDLLLVFRQLIDEQPLPSRLLNQPSPYSYHAYKNDASALLIFSAERKTQDTNL